MNNLQHIKSKLHSFIKKYFLNELLRGFILFVVFGILYFFATILVEYFLWLPSTGRQYLYYALWVVTAILFIVFLLIPLLNYLGVLKKLDLEKSARIIGDFFPEIKDKLINTLQLEHNESSSDLLLASIEQKANRLKPFQFTKAIDYKRSLKFLPLLLIPFIIFFVLKLTHIDKDVSQSYERVISYRQDFTPPPPFKISILSKDKVIKGQSHTIKLLVKGSEIPDKLSFISNQKQLQFKRENDSVFTYFIPLVNKDIAYKVKADKHSFGPYRLSIILPPTIYKIDVNLHFPPYLHKRNQSFQHTGNFTVPEGTTITWKLQTLNTQNVKFTINNKTKLMQVNNDKVSIKKLATSDFTYALSPQNTLIKDFEQLSYNVSVVKDQFPELKVLEKIDTVNNRNLYKILATDDNGLHKLQLNYKIAGASNFKQVNIPISRTDMAQINYIFPGNLPIEDGKSYQYFFKLYDNDAFHHYKSVNSKTFYFNKLTAKQMQDINLNQQKSTLQDLQKLKKNFNKQQAKLNKFNKQLTQQKALDWQSKNKLENTIKQAEKQEEFFNQAVKKYKDLLDKMPEKKDDLTKEELKKRLDELAKLEKKKKLLDELKKLADKLKKEDLVEKLKDLEKYSEHQEKSLERILELTKKYYMQQKLKKLADDINKLAQKQEKLAKDNLDTKKSQDSLNKQFDKLQKQSDSLQKMNKKFKAPMNMPDKQPDFEDIKQDMENASDKLDQNQSSQANKKQQKAANKMKKLSKEMAQSMAGGGEEQNEEDIATLQALLKSLLNFSFKEEALITQLYTKHEHTYLPKQLLSQNNLKNYYKHISDSLYTLTLRNPKISQFVLDQSFEISSSIDKTLNKLADNNYPEVNRHAQYILSGANTLANMLSKVLDAQKNSKPGQGQGKGKKGKGESFSLPDIIKKQGQSISQMKDALSKRDGKGKKKDGKKDGEKQGDKKGKEGSGKNGEEQAKKQFELYKQQQSIKEDLQQLGDKFSDKAAQQKAKDLAKQMDDLQKRLLKEGLTQSVLNKMIQLQHELLKLKNATFTQHEDNKRESISNTKNYQSIDSLFYKDNPLFIPQNELLKRSQIPVNQKVKSKIIEYLKN